MFFQLPLPRLPAQWGYGLIKTPGLPRDPDLYIICMGSIHKIDRAPLTGVVIGFSVAHTRFQNSKNLGAPTPSILGPPHQQVVYWVLGFVWISTFQKQLDLQAEQNLDCGLWRTICPKQTSLVWGPQPLRCWIFGLSSWWGRNSRYRSNLLENIFTLILVHNITKGAWTKSIYNEIPL